MKESKGWNFVADGVNDYYAGVIEVLLSKGTETSPRGKRTMELHPTTVLIHHPRKRLTSCFGRVLNLPFALAEALQIITGQNDAQALSFYNSGIIDIQGDGSRGTPHWQLGVMRFNAAYGERLRHFDLIGAKVDQLEHVIETLKRDPDSRQASMVMSHPLHDNFTVNTVDRACNVYAHAMIREGKLDWMQVIRSNDAIWGIPYNMVQWSHVQEWVAASLNIPVGTMFIVQDSFHVYADKYAEARRVSAFDIYNYVQPSPMQASDEIADNLRRYESIVRGGGEIDVKDMYNTVGLYWTDVIRTLLSYRAFKRSFDDMAFDILPDNAEFRALMLRMYCQYRWNKLRAVYADILDAAHLELSSMGIPHEEVRKWLGTQQARS